jgi:hypothetical protein
MQVSCDHTMDVGICCMGKKLPAPPKAMVPPHYLHLAPHTRQPTPASKHHDGSNQLPTPHTALLQRRTTQPTPKLSAVAALFKMRTFVGGGHPQPQTLKPSPITPKPET